MEEKILLALKNAEKNYQDYKNLKDEQAAVPEHIIALHTLFDSFVHYGLAASQIMPAICELDEQSYLFEVLIEPHLRVVDDTQMIAREYAKMYLQFIARLAHGDDSKSAVTTLFA